MKDTVFGFFQDTVMRFPERDFQRIRRGNAFAGIHYKDCYRQVEEFGEGLLSLGIKKGDRVGLLCDNSPDWIIANLALQAVGAPDVPRNTDVPLRDLEVIIEDSGAENLILQNKATFDRFYPSLSQMFPLKNVILLEDNWSGKPANVWGLDELVQRGKGRIGRGRRISEEASNVVPSDISTIIYTSGTAGKPKGVILTNANFGYIFSTVPPMLDLNETDRVVNILPPWHAFERGVEYAVMSAGASMSYSSKENLLEDMQLEKPTYMATVPIMWQIIYYKARQKLQRQPQLMKNLSLGLVDSGIKYKRAQNYLRGRYPDSSNLSLGKRIAARGDELVNFLPYRLADILVFKKLRELTGGNLKAALFGGAHLPEHIEDFFDAAGIVVLEGYGMTEAAPLVSLRLPGNGALYTAGKPLPGTEVKVVDEFMQPVDRGTPGVLYARGPQIMKGYTDPHATMQTLSPDGWFNTGDTVRVTKEGDLKILGRDNDNFKLSDGMWIVPQTLEDEIKKSQFVQEAMVIGPNRDYLSCLVFPDWEYLKEEAGRRGMQVPQNTGRANKLLGTDPQFVADIGTDIKRLTSGIRGFDDFHRIKDFRIIYRPLEIGKELTVTEKLKRNYVLNEYKDLIEEIYKPK